MNHRFAIAAVLTALALGGCATGPAPAGKRALMIVGNDEKQGWNDAGAPSFGHGGPGHGVGHRHRQRSARAADPSPACR